MHLNNCEVVLYNGPSGAAAQASSGIHEGFIFLCPTSSLQASSPSRKCIMYDVEHFLDVDAMTFDMIARIINQNKIQILIILMATTQCSN